MTQYAWSFHLTRTGDVREAFPHSQCNPCGYVAVFFSLSDRKGLPTILSVYNNKQYNSIPDPPRHPIIYGHPEPKCTRDHQEACGCLMCIAFVIYRKTGNYIPLYITRNRQTEGLQSSRYHLFTHTYTHTAGFNPVYAYQWFWIKHFRRHPTLIYDVPDLYLRYPRITS